MIVCSFGSREQFKGVLSEPNPVFTGVPKGVLLGCYCFLIHFNLVILFGTAEKFKGI